MPSPSASAKLAEREQRITDLRDQLLADGIAMDPAVALTIATTTILQQEKVDQWQSKQTH